MEHRHGKVLIAAPVHTVLTEGLTALGYTCVYAEQITQDAAYQLIGDCTGVITSTRLQLDKELLDTAPGLQWIGRMGSGMEVIDMPYAAERNIACYGSPEGNCNAVGEHALGMLLMLIRRMGWSNNEVKHGLWKREENRGTELEGKKIGIIGYGHTGAAFAKKLQGFDVQVLAYDKHDTQPMPKYVSRCESIGRIYEEADIVSFHVPLQADTIHYVNDEFVHNMRKSFVLINTSRGKVADTFAIKKGLDNGKIAGACLDVLEEEPLNAMNSALRGVTDELAAMPNVVITPHIAGYTYEALFKMSYVLLKKISNKGL